MLRHRHNRAARRSDRFTATGRRAGHLLGWAELKAQRLTANVQHRRGDTSESVLLEVPVVVAPPIMMSSPVVMIGEMITTIAASRRFTAGRRRAMNFRSPSSNVPPPRASKLAPPECLGPQERVLR